MFYCPGEFCSKKDICLHYHLKDSKHIIQLLDMSTQGSGYEAIDSAGNRISHHEYHCGDRAPKYYSLWELKTWQDKVDFENAYNSAHAEGFACRPGTYITIINKQGQKEVIPFDPKTLTLDTEVLRWH